jgi:hypothetical protein
VKERNGVLAAAVQMHLRLSEHIYIGLTGFIVASTVIFIIP